METKQGTPFVDKVVDSLRKAAVELEELQLQTALGKAEAKDKFEEVKKGFNSFMHESKTTIKSEGERVEEIHGKIDNLRVQLALGKAESLDAYKGQKKNLLLAVHDLEVNIKTNEKLRKMYSVVLVELDKFKIQLEILEKRFSKRTEEANNSFENGKKDFNKFVDGIKGRFTTKEDTRWDHFQGEVSEAFDHFKKAFVKPA